MVHIGEHEDSSSESDYSDEYDEYEEYEDQAKKREEEKKKNEEMKKDEEKRKAEQKKKEEEKKKLANPCGSGKHIKSTDLFCKDCIEMVCGKCLACHPTHEVVDYEDLLLDIINDSKKFSDDLKSAIAERSKEKDINHEIFNEKVKTHYEQQNNLISDTFKELHNILHFREVELKRELKSYQDENEETLATLLSTIDNEIQQSTEFIQEVETFKSNPEEPEKNLKFVNDYFQTLNTTKNGKPTEFLSYKMYALLNTKSEETIPTLTKLVQKKSTPLFQKANKNMDLGGLSNVIYTYGKDGVEKYNIVTDESKFILEPGVPNSPPFMSFYWHYTVINGVIYMFDRGQAWILDTNAQVPAWRELKFAMNSSSSCSAIYDGKDFIYIFGGYSLANNQDIVSIYKFNIHTEEFFEAGKKLINSSYLSLSYHDGTIYLIGGYNTTNSWLNRLDKFDTVTGQVEHITKITNTDVLVNSGIYIAKYNSFFAFTWTANFYKIDMAGVCVKLAKPGCSPNYTKSFYNGDNLIYLIVERDRDIYIYNIDKDTFSKQPNGFQNEIFSSNFVGCATD